MLIFGSEHPMFKELLRLGYIVPNCQSVEIILAVKGVPNVVVRALANDELATAIEKWKDIAIDLKTEGP